MKGFTVPSLTSAVYKNGDAVAIGDVVVPVMVVVDVTNKVVMRRGDPVTIVDDTPPTNLSTVSVVPGTTPSSEITFTGLSSITDNVAVTSITVFYGVTNSVNAASSEAATVGVDTFTVTGLNPDTQYYCWTSASDAAGNTSGPTPVAETSITTSAAAPSAYSSLNDETFYQSGSYATWSMTADPTVNREIYYNSISSTGGFTYNFGEWDNSDVTLVFKARLSNTNSYAYGGGSGFGRMFLQYGTIKWAGLYQDYANSSIPSPFIMTVRDETLASNSAFTGTNMITSHRIYAFMVDWTAQTLRFASYDSTGEKALIEQTTFGSVIKPAVVGGTNINITLSTKGACYFAVQDFYLTNSVLTDEQVRALALRS